MARIIATMLTVTAIAAGGAPAVAQSQYQHDHPWAVDFDGIERPLYGCWVLAAVTHPARAEFVGDMEQVRSTLFGVDEFRVEVQVTAPDGTVWSRAAMISGDREAFITMRLDTSTEPHRWYAIMIRDDDGRPTAAFPETEGQFTGEDPNTDLATFERISCADR